LDERHHLYRAHRAINHDEEMKMSKATKNPQDANADRVNANKGTSGTNKIYDKDQGNQGKLNNPTYQNSRKSK
jgi:hypothetical protein